MADISKIKLPDGTTYNIKDPNATDTKVTQTADTTNAYFPILLAGTADSTTRTEGTKKSGELVFNPNAKELHVQKVVSELFVAQNSDHTSATTISSNQAVFMGDVVVVGGLSCNNISLGVEDISENYVPSKTSGNWSIGSDDGVYRIKAYRMGNLVQMTIAFHGNGSAVSSGSNGFIGAITGGALPIARITLTGFYSSSALMATLEEDGAITVRPFSASCTLSSASRAYLTGTFLTDSYE